MDFSIEEGKRLNSLNYTSDGYRYTKYRESNETVYLRCTLAKRCACKGTAKISSTSKDLLEMTKAHNHSRIEHKSEIIILANRIKRAAAVSTDNLREVFNDECRNSSAGSSISFKQLESTLCKRRRLDLPKLPSSPEEFSQSC